LVIPIGLTDADIFNINAIANKNESIMNPHPYGRDISSMCADVNVPMQSHVQL